MAMTLIKAVYRGNCRVCGVKVNKGEMAWFKGAGGVLCVDCGNIFNSPAGRMRREPSWIKFQVEYMD